MRKFMTGVWMVLAVIAASFPIASEAGLTNVNPTGRYVHPAFGCQYPHFVNVLSGNKFWPMPGTLGAISAA